MFPIKHCIMVISRPSAADAALLNFRQYLHVLHFYSITDRNARPLVYFLKIDWRKFENVRQFWIKATEILSHCKMDY